MKNKPRLQIKYEKEVVSKVKEEFGIKNPMEVPSLRKIVVNMGVGEAAKNKETMESLKRDIAAITGQAPSVRAAKVSIAAFNLRRGMPVGLSVTLRKEKMYSFLDKLISIVLPRLRDFRGVSPRGFDKDGNYTLGFAEHTVFPEIDVTKVTAPHGLEVTIVTKNSSVEKGKKLLELLGMPFEKT